METGNPERNTERGLNTVSMTPIGVIRTPFSNPVGTPIQGALAHDAKGTVVLEPAFHAGIDDLDGFSHLILLYAFDRIDGFCLKVKPYLDDRERGIFATRSPCRPNPIGMTVVRLLGIKEGSLAVGGVDMLDGTPLLDIKPSVPEFDYSSSVRCGWFEPHLHRLKRDKDVPVADARFHGKVNR